MAKGSKAAAALGRRRMASMSAEELRAHQSAAGRASWANMTAAERRAEFRRRLRGGKRRKKSARG